MVVLQCILDSSQDSGQQRKTYHGTNTKTKVTNKLERGAARRVKSRSVVAQTNGGERNERDYWLGSWIGERRRKKKKEETTWKKKIKKNRQIESDVAGVKEKKKTSDQLYKLVGNHQQT